MKTTHEIDEVRKFVSTLDHTEPNSVCQLSEGHISQAFRFELSSGEKRVLRISAKKEDFLGDEYAFSHFGKNLPIPRVIAIGQFNDNSFYCISDFVAGETTNNFSTEQMMATLTAQNDIFAKIFMTNISNSSGYGDLNINTGNAPFKSWKAALIDDVKKMKSDHLHEHAKNIGLDPNVIDRFLEQFNVNLSFASEIRRLVHGDLGFDNIIMHQGRVVAVIDWAQMSYGDWMYDYAKFDFWWPGRYTKPDMFARRYSLDGEHIQERAALYWAYTALGTISFADKYKNKTVAQWLRTYASEKILR